MTEEQSVVLDAYINMIVSTKHRLTDYIEKFELYGFLTKEEVQFLNEIALACQNLADTNTSRILTNQEKEELH